MPFFNVEKKIKKKPKILYLTVKTLKQLLFLDIYEKRKHNTHNLRNKLQKKIIKNFVQKSVIKNKKLG